jgi:hypothetical protein
MSSTLARVATCVSGEARTIAQPCTFAATLERIVVPLHSELFIAINVPNLALVDQTRALVRNMATLYGVSLVFENVYVYQSIKGECDDLLGYPQADGFVQCAQSIFSQRVPYEWVIRTRPDLYVPFFIKSLPSAHSMQSVAIAGYVLGRCNAQIAWWTDDRFALLPTRHVQHAYLLGYKSDFCKRPCNHSSCRPGECKLGWTLGTRQITPLHLPSCGGASAPPSRLNVKLIRHSDNVSCVVETSGNPSHYHSWLEPPLMVDAGCLLRLPRPIDK